MATPDHQEFKDAVRDIAQYAHKLNSPFDRVRCVEWVRKLTGLSEDDLETVKIKNNYIQFLRIQVCNGFLHPPFLSEPPKDALVSLAERIGTLMVSHIPELPKIGPIAPVIHHRSPDGRAFITAKQIPGGVLCYLAKIVVKAWIEGAAVPNTVTTKISLCHIHLRSIHSCQMNR